VDYIFHSCHQKISCHQKPFKILKIRFLALFLYMHYFFDDMNEKCSPQLLSNKLNKILFRTGK
jgi:hypothetical protein